MSFVAVRDLSCNAAIACAMPWATVPSTEAGTRNGVNPSRCAWPTAAASVLSSTVNTVR